MTNTTEYPIKECIESETTCPILEKRLEEIEERNKVFAELFKPFLRSHYWMHSLSEGEDISSKGNIREHISLWSD